MESVSKLAGLPVKFVFVGNGALLEEVRKTHAEYPDQVWIADQVKHNEVHQWMNALDILVLPSLTKPNWKEQFGRVIIESMACGVPVLGSDSGEIPKLIGETGGGWVCPEGRTDDLVAAIRRISADEDDCRRKANAGFMSVQNKYSKRTLAKAFEQQIIELRISTERAAK